MAVTLRQLRAFIAVAREESFTRAADKLGLSQSSVSGLITELENNLGMRLFDRHTRMLSTTGAGLELLPAVEKAVADIDSVIDSSNELRMLGRGRVSIAVSSIQAALLLPRFVKTFRSDYPGVQVKLLDVSEHEVPEMVRSGNVDFGVGTEFDIGLDLTALPLIMDEFVAVMRSDDPLARMAELNWRDLSDSVVIGPLKGNPVREYLDNALAREGISLVRTHEVYLPLTMLGMVEAGLGVSVMSTAVNRLARALDLVTRPLINPLIRREVSLIFRADRSLSPSAQSFRDLLFSSRAEIMDS